jgi:NAD(P)-dependent dehydrogenase (short-subunit alcohol dehydrogenase family)
MTQDSAPLSEGNPPQHQGRQPGLEAEMTPPPRSDAAWYRGSGKLDGRRALITGGDSGIGRAVARLFAREGADVAIVYLDEHDDAQQTAKLLEQEGGRCLLFSGDIADETFCRRTVTQAAEELGGLDILVNNAAEQHVRQDLTDISHDQLVRTFATNVFGAFLMTKAVLAHLKEGAAIITTTSVAAYQGHPALLDYSATKGALVAFTRALSANLAQRGIRVNAVAPGPIWTPLIPASFPAEQVESFGRNTPLGRPGQPDEVAPCYVFLASDDARYITGQVLHPNGGQIVGS